MMDLNDFVPDDYADHLYTANDINNLGQITGYTVKAGTRGLARFLGAAAGEARTPRLRCRFERSKERCEARAATRGSPATSPRSRGRYGGAARAVTIE